MYEYTYEYMYVCNNKINYKYIMSLAFTKKHDSAFIKQISMQIYITV